jgi:hypothetical protein
MFDSPGIRPISEEEVARALSMRSDEPIAGELEWVPPDPLDEVERLERRMAMLLGQQLVEIARHIQRSVAEHESWYLQDAYRSAHAEVGLRLGLGAGTETRLISDATRFTERLPATLDAMCSGELTYAKGKVILDETENIDDPEILAKVETKALEVAGGFAAPRLREKVQRFIEQLDADALRKRAEKARADRAVRLHRRPDGMAEVNAFLPIEVALPFFGVVDTVAHACQGPDEDRTIDQLRADVLVDLVCHPADQPSRVTHEVQVVATAEFLLHRDGADPARLADGTPLPDDLARAIAADSRWRLILTDPLTRHLLDVGARAYEPPDRTVRFIRARDRRCRWPGCGRPAKRCETDHTVKFRVGGLTIVINLASLCKRHHSVKDLPGWDAIQDPDTGALTFVTPRGDRYTTRPPTADGDQHPVERVLANTGPEAPPF